MRKQTGILGLCLTVGFILQAIPAAAQVKYEDLQGLKPSSSETLILLPSGTTLKSGGLDSWTNRGPGGEALLVRSFTSNTKTEDQKFFALGNLYMALLVQVGSPSTLDATTAISSFRDVLTQLRAPVGFFSYLSELELMTKSHDASPKVAVRIAGAIQGFLSEFVRSRGEAAFLNYQAGQWCTTVALAAHAHDAASLQLGVARSLRERFATRNPSVTVVAALNALDDMASKEKLDDADFAQIEKLAGQLRDQLE